MAYSYDFKDNVVYGAEHINAIRGSILTKGVIEENENSLKAEFTETGIKINSGQAIFDDGCRIAVDEEGVELNFSAGVKNYIYLYNNILLGICEIKVSTEAPEGDFVLLAEVDADGNLSDKRRFSELKADDSERYVESFSAQLSMNCNMPANTVIGEVELPKSNCSMIDFSMNFSGVKIAIRIFPKESVMYWGQNNIFLEKTEKNITFFCLTTNITLSFEVIGNKMIVKVIYVSKADDIRNNITILGTCIR